MKTTTATSPRVDILGNGSNSAQEILTAGVKRCRQSVGYLSVFATLPALLLPNIHEAHTEEIKRRAAIVPEDAAKLNGRFNGEKTSKLLKRQSKFRLPHQNNLSLAFEGADDCPGHPIPGGSYPAAAPYIENGDTTTANNTISSFLHVQFWLPNRQFSWARPYIFVHPYQPWSKSKNRAFHHIGDFPSFDLSIARRVP